MHPGLAAIHDLGLLLQDAVLSLLRQSNLDFNWRRVTANELFDIISPAFSLDYMTWRWSSLLEFQRITDTDYEFTDSFIQEHTTGDCVCALTNQIASNGLSMDKSITQFDDPKMVSSLSSTISNRITQIDISGPTVKAAWYNNATTRQLESHLPQNTAWTPSQFSRLSVSHGTDAQFKAEHGFAEV